jgi:hypothetical protein
MFERSNKNDPGEEMRRKVVRFSAKRVEREISFAIPALAEDDPDTYWWLAALAERQAGLIEAARKNTANDDFSDRGRVMPHRDYLRVMGGKVTHPSTQETTV